jgi:predicted enzyme related to lactoylglutathione lyase
MPIKTKHEPGTFSWAELATTDSSGAKKFYGALLGWEFDDMPSGPGMVYSMSKVGGQYVGGVFDIHGDMKGMPPNWASYVTVEDADAMVKKVTANGGKLIKEPFDVFDVGRMAVIQDPTGAPLCIWQPKKHIGAGVIHDPGAMTWNELFTSDVDRAGKFYAATFGWTTTPVDMGPAGTYTLFGRAGEKNNVGGMMPLGPQMKGVPPHWLVYFAVTDVDASAKKAAELGGKVMSPPMDIPNVGRFAVVQDPQGAVLALYKGAH